MQLIQEFTTEETIIDLINVKEVKTGGFRLNLLNCTPKMWEDFIEIIRLNENDINPDFNDIEVMLKNKETAYFGLMSYSVNADECVALRSDILAKLKDKNIDQLMCWLFGDLSLTGTMEIMNDVSCVCPNGNIFFATTYDESCDGMVTAYIFAV